MMARPYLSWTAMACVFIATSTAPLAIPSNPSAIANNGGPGARIGSGVASSIPRIAAVVVLRLPKRAVNTPLNGSPNNEPAAMPSSARPSKPSVKPSACLASGICGTQLPSAAPLARNTQPMARRASRVRVADCPAGSVITLGSFAEPRWRHSPRALLSIRNEADGMSIRIAQPFSEMGCKRGTQDDLLGPQIIGGGIDRHRSTVGGHQILQQLDARAAAGAQCGDAEMCAGHRRQALLFDTPIIARAGDAQAEPVPIESDTLVGIGCRDRAMVDAEKQPVLLLPARLALVGRELAQFERMAVRVAEIGTSDTASVPVPRRQKLRPF